MKNKILTTSLALALGLTILAPTAKADELDDLLNGATEIEDDLNQNTGDLDKLKKEKVVIPAKEIEDIAKPTKKEEKPKEDLGNNEVGFKTKAAAENAAKEALKNDPINKNFSVSENNGKFFYVLTAAEDLSNVKEDKKEEKTPEKPYAKYDEKADEKSFDFDKGFKTKDEAIKQAEALVKNSKINKGYNISKGVDGRYYIQLTPQEEKTEGVERKPIEKGNLKEIKEEKRESTSKERKGTNVQTGVAGIGGVVATLSAATIGLFKSKRK